MAGAVALVCAGWTFTTASYGQELHADQVYQQYHQKLLTVTDISELRAFIPKRETNFATNLAGRRSTLVDLATTRRLGPFDVRVIYWKQAGDNAVIQATGQFADLSNSRRGSPSTPDTEPRRTQWGYATMVREDDGWKMRTEHWLDENLPLKPQLDKATTTWCAAAASETPPTTPAKGRFFNRPHSVIRATFYSRHHCLDIYTHEEHYPPDHIKLSIQYPDSVSSIEQIGIRKPGSAVPRGLKFGLQLDHGGSTIYNVWDNDDPYGLLVEYVPGESGPECSINLRLPDGQRSFLSGRIPVEVWQYRGASPDAGSGASSAASPDAGTGAKPVPAKTNLLPERTEFFKIIEIAVHGQMDGVDACANAQKGMRLAIKLTANADAYRTEREMKGGYLMEDVATWAMNFLSKSCAGADMKPLVDALVKAEATVAQANEPGLAVAYLNAADFYRLRCNDDIHAAMYYDLAVQAIPKVEYERTHSYLPEKFAAALLPYEEMLASQPHNAARCKQIKILRIQQMAKHMNNVGNKYLDGVTEPPARSGLYAYEVNHAVDAYTKAIELIPRWAEPYRGRARAYELLGKHDLAAKDRSKADELER